MENPRPTACKIEWVNSKNKKVLQEVVLFSRNLLKNKHFHSFYWSDHPLRPGVT